MSRSIELIQIQEDLAKLIHSHYGAWLHHFEEIGAVTIKDQMERMAGRDYENLSEAQKQFYRKLASDFLCEFYIR